ncbi:MAG TPA: hypothetical protein VE673_19350 [Pseudonocardiaceae bacterium]|nr:hypothetical protein [Pseudonocardiaceae bacterium]
MGDAQIGPRRWWVAVAGVEVDDQQTCGLAGDADGFSGFTTVPHGGCAELGKLTCALM